VDLQEARQLRAVRAAVADEHVQVLLGESVAVFHGDRLVCTAGLYAVSVDAVVDATVA